MYIKKEIQNMINKLDKQLVEPKKWSKFISDEKEKNNIIVKNKNIYRCINCNYEFNSKEKINKKCKCPNCKNIYVVKSSTLKYYEIKKDLLLLERIDDNWILRVFELLSYLKDKNFNHSIVEYGRTILSNSFNYEYDIVNQHLNTNMTWSVRHCEFPNISGYIWRVFKGSYHGDLSSAGTVYPYNLKKIMSNTQWKYSRLWILAKHSDRLNILDLMKSNYASTELLIKSGLYNLTLSSKRFNKKGSFEDRFGISKDYYKFIKRYNLNIQQLEALKLVKEKNIKIINWCNSFNNAEEIAKYLSLKRLYRSKYKIKDEHLYLDYLKFAKELGYDMKNKNILFPFDLKEEHDKLSNLYEIKKNKKIQSKILKRYKALLKNKFSNKKYIIFPANSFLALQDEATQQNNCVKTYAEDYSKGICDLYFMRLLDNEEKSLVTVEVRNNKVVQSRIINNDRPNKEQLRFLENWEHKKLNAP